MEHYVKIVDACKPLTRDLNLNRSWRLGDLKDWYCPCLLVPENKRDYLRQFPKTICLKTYENAALRIFYWTSKVRARLTELVIFHSTTKCQLKPPVKKHLESQTVRDTSLHESKSWWLKFLKHASADVCFNIIACFRN